MCIRDRNDGQGGFELVRGVGHKLALLFPALFHRPYRPLGQQQTDAKENRQGAQTDENQVPGQGVKGAPLLSQIHKGDAIAQNGVHPQKAQMVVALVDGAGVGGIFQGVIDYLEQSLLIGGVKKLVGQYEQGVLAADLNGKIGQLDLVSAKERIAPLSLGVEVGGVAGGGVSCLLYTSRCV